MFLGEPADLAAAQLAQDLAIQQAAEHVDAVDRGKIEGATANQIARVIGDLEPGLLTSLHLSRSDERRAFFNTLRDMGADLEDPDVRVRAHLSFEGLLDDD
jgi:hypothetical protein